MRFLGAMVVFPMSGVAKRSLLVLFGISAALVVIETSMRAAGWAIRHQQVQRNREVLRRQDQVRVVCLGESTTAGDVLSGRYPEMLERILNQQEIDATFAVVNLGRPGAVSGSVVDALARSLDKVAPALVVSMLGINDAGNTHSYGSMIANGEGRWYGTWRLYKLYRVVLYAAARAWPTSDSLSPLVLGAGITALPDASVAASSAEWAARNRPSAPRQPEIRPTVSAITYRIARGEGATAEEELLRLLEADPGYADLYLWLARARQSAGRDEAAHETLLRGLQAMTGVSPGLGAAAAESHFLHGDHELALAMQRRVVAEMIDPADAGTRIHHILKLAEMYERAGRLTEAEAVLRDLVERVRPGDAMLHEYLILLYERAGLVDEAAAERELQHRIRYEYINPRTRENYSALRRLLAARGVPLVAVQYPGRDVQTLRRMFDGDDKVAYVDNAFFRDLVSAGGYERYFRDRFAGDFGHLTLEGNCLLARNVARAITERIYGLRFNESLATCEEERRGASENLAGP